MQQELGPVDETLVDLLEGFGVVVRQADLLPPLAGHVGALGRLDVEVEALGVGVGADRGIAAVGQRARLAVTEARDIVFVAAEVLVFGCSVGICLVSASLFGCWFSKRCEGCTDFSLKEQNCWLMTPQTISSDAIVAG